MLMEGFEASIAVVKEVLNTRGPFDGLLTFSQGSSLYRFYCHHTKTSPVAFHLMFAGTAYPKVILRFNNEYHLHGSHPV